MPQQRSKILHAATKTHCSCINILKNTSTSKHKINKKKVFRREKEILIAKFSYMNFVSFFFPPKVLYRWYCCLVLFYRWENWGLEMLNWAQGLATGKKQQGVQSLSLALTRRGDWPRGQCSLNGGTLSGTSIEAQVGRPSPASVSRVPWPQAAGLQLSCPGPRGKHGNPLLTWVSSWDNEFLEGRDLSCLPVWSQHQLCPQQTEGKQALIQWTTSKPQPSHVTKVR